MTKGDIMIKTYLRPKEEKFLSWLC